MKIENTSNYPAVSQELQQKRKETLLSKGFKKWNNHIKRELKKYSYAGQIC